MLTDNQIYAFLAARRKAVWGLLAIAGILTTANLGHPLTAATIVQAIVGFLGVYGIHEVANDDPDTGAHAAS